MTVTSPEEEPLNVKLTVDAGAYARAMSKINGSVPEASKVDPDERDWVSAAEIEQQADLSYRQVDYWTRTGLLCPLGLSAPGNGYRRRYPKAELHKAVALNALLDAGLQLPWLRQHIDQILADGHLSNGPVTITYLPTNQIPEKN